MKNLFLVIGEMSAGGAERVISLFSIYLSQIYNINLIITNQKICDAKLEFIPNNIHVLSLLDCDINEKESKYLFRIISKFSKSYSKIYRFYSKNRNRIIYLRKLFDKNSVIISFLNEPIFLSLLSKGDKNKLIISERNDPSKFENTKTTMAFIHKLYHKADVMVCQSPDAEKWYKQNSKVKTKVIFNPIKPDLPESFVGERKKTIVNFCRISDQKNLIMLVEAFSLLSIDFPDYNLQIIGDEAGNRADGYLEKVKYKIAELNLSEKVFLEPARTDVHEYVKDCAMFVSSSDFEGMSNSMLEAMAMGMPVVCTDCPAGGARAVITDHENGLLVPVGDADAMYRAMKELIENPDLAEKLGKNAYHIRENQSVENIINQWVEIINE